MPRVLRGVGELFPEEASCVFGCEGVTCNKSELVEVVAGDVLAVCSCPLLLEQYGLSSHPFYWMQSSVACRRAVLRRRWGKSAAFESPVAVGN